VDEKALTQLDFFRVIRFDAIASAIEKYRRCILLF